MNKLILAIILGLASLAWSQTPSSLGALTFDYANPQTFEIGPIRVIGADNYDHQAIKLIAGLKQGQSITIPGQQISTAIKNLWNEGIFYVENSFPPETIFANILYFSSICKEPSAE